MNDKNNKELGVCRLCGQYKKLTYEHVPLQSTFNNNRLKVYTGEQIFSSDRENKAPWDVQGIRYKNVQKGKGGYYLCSECNNNTGSWYGKEYSLFVNGIGNNLIEAMNDERSDQLSSISFEIKPMYIMRIFKQILTMFCDINENLHNDKQLQEYLLNPYERSFDINRYKMFMYLTTDGMEKLMPFFQVFAKGQEPLYISEIVSFPLGFSLFVDLNDSINIPGANINCFSSVGYDEKSGVSMLLPVLNNYSGIPMDYRTKDEILRDMKINKDIQDKTHNKK